MLLIIDNQSTFIKQFKRDYLAEQDFDYMFFDHNQPLIIPKDKDVCGLILSGGKGNPYTPLNLTANFVALMNFDVPTIGFCLGHEIIAIAYRARLKKHSEPQNKKQLVRITKPQDPIFNSINKTEIFLKEKHNFYLSQIPDSFECIGESDICEYEIIKHKEKPIYGFQSHPEVSGKDGITIMENFFKMCNLI